jgi:hypothetical protein
MRLHLLAAPDGTAEPRSSLPPIKENAIALRMLPLGLRGAERIIADKGYAGKDFATTVAHRHAAVILRPLPGGKRPAPAPCGGAWDVCGCHGGQRPARPSEADVGTFAGPAAAGALASPSAPLTTTSARVPPAPTPRLT